MFEPLLDADPSLVPLWEAFVEEWRDENESPLYLALAEVARRLIKQLELGDTERFDAVFGVVEQWHLKGNSYVREAGSVGLLESLQNNSLHGRLTTPDGFEPWLLPESKRWWDKLNKFWTNGKPMTDD